MSWPECEECGGCTNDECWGCGARWCGGTYMGEGCDRCPNKVPKDIFTPHPRTVLAEMTVDVRCNGKDGHSGVCHWDPWQVGR